MMNKLEETLLAHPEMSPAGATRVAIRKVSDPTLKQALESVVDFIELLAGPSKEFRAAKSEQVTAAANARDAAEALEAQKLETEPAPPPAS